MKEMGTPVVVLALSKVLTVLLVTTTDVAASEGPTLSAVSWILCPPIGMPLYPNLKELVPSPLAQKTTEVVANETSPATRQAVIDVVEALPTALRVTVPVVVPEIIVPRVPPLSDKEPDEVRV